MVKIEDTINTQELTAEQILFASKKLAPDLYLFDRNSACKKVSVLTDYYVLLYSEKINKQFNLRLSRSFYANILTPYLGYVISVTYSKFLRYEKFLEKKEAINTFNFSDCPDESIFNTSECFFNNIYSNISFHEWIDYILAKHLSSKNLVKYGAQKNIELNAPYRPHTKGIKDNITHYVNRKICFSNIYGFSLYQSLTLSFLLCIKCWFLSFTSVCPRQEQENRKIDIADFTIQFMSAIDEIINKSMPKSFLENFKEKFEKAATMKKHTKILFKSVACFYSDEVIFHALRKLRGRVICFAQHGCGYFTSYSHIKEICEFMCDRFFSWGSEFNKASGQCQFSNAPSPMLSRLLDSHKQQKEELIFVGTNINPLWDGILYPNPFWIGRYLSEKKNFFSKLNHVIFNNSFYKLYPSPNYKNFDELTFVSQLFPSLKFLDRGHLLEEKIKTSKIFVIDHFDSTTFYKCMAANTPVVCYNGFPFFDFYPKAKAFNKKLKSINILFDHAEEAAEFINNNWGAIDTWWNSFEVQEARKEFCALYAQTNKKYLFAWIKLILKIK